MNMDMFREKPVYEKSEKYKQDCIKYHDTPGIEEIFEDGYSRACYDIFNNVEGNGAITDCQIQSLMKDFAIEDTEYYTSEPFTKASVVEPTDELIVQQLLYTLIRMLKEFPAEKREHIAKCVAAAKTDEEWE